MKYRFLILWLVLALFAVQHIAAETYSGTDGNIHWTLDTESGELIISGTGTMNNYSYNASRTNAPWGTYYLSIRTVTIESGVTSIGDNAFYGCTALMEINAKMTNPPALQNSVFTYVDKDACQLIVPASSVDTYKKTSGWKDFNNIVADPDTDHINSMKAESDDVRYNLSGQRINATEKGIVIINGKKLYVK